MTIWPVDAEVSQAYGSNPTANLPASSWLIQTFGNYQPNGHTGVDFPVAVGTPVKAVAAGTVKHVGWYSGSYADNPYWIAPAFAGFCLVIDHGSFVGIYAHLSGSNMIVGQSVREGQVVASSGNTGGSTGPHLHFEVLPDGWDFNNGMYGRVNPARYITGITAQSSIPAQVLENIMATLSNAEKEELMTAVRAINARLKYLDAPVSKVDEAVLDAKVTRADVGGQTSLRSTIAYLDTNLNAIREAKKAV
jgi:hypothetical protein